MNVYKFCNVSWCNLCEMGSNKRNPKYVLSDRIISCWQFASSAEMASSVKYGIPDTWL